VYVQLVSPVDRVALSVPPIVGLVGLPLEPSFHDRQVDVIVRDG
jgi:hypothetical protein